MDLGLRRKFSHIFTVANVSRPIIGADFLAYFGLMVDLKQRKLHDKETSLSVNAILLNSDTPCVKILTPIGNDFCEIIREYPNLTLNPRFDLPLKHNVVHYITTN